MGMGKMSVAYRAPGVRRRYRKRRTNKKLATVGTVKRLIAQNIDPAFNSTQAVSAQNVTTTAVITDITNFAGGDDVRVDSLKIRLYLTNPTLNAAVRIIFFQWQDHTVPVIGDLLSFTTDPASPLGRDAGPDGERCGGRMHILKDMFFPMNTSTYSVRTYVLNFYKKKLLDIKYNGYNITPTYENLIYVCYLSSTAVTPPVLSVDTLIKYHDN